MAIAPSAKVWTWQEALALPGGERYEVIDGELKERVMSVQSSAIAMAIAAYLGQWVRSGHPGTVLGSDGGYTIFPWAPGDVRMPDVSYVSQARMPRVPARGWSDVAPEFAVEVVSPTDLALDVDLKAHDYIRAGVDLVSVVFPRTRTIVVYRPGLPQTSFGPGETVNGGDVLPGLSVSIDELFAPFE
jgi:Uma2 family endonuclease